MGDGMGEVEGEGGGEKEGNGSHKERLCFCGLCFLQSTQKKIN